MPREQFYCIAPSPTLTYKALRRILLHAGNHSGAVITPGEEHYTKIVVLNGVLPSDVIILHINVPNDDNAVLATSSKVLPIGTECGDQYLKE